MSIKRECVQRSFLSRMLFAALLAYIAPATVHSATLATIPMFGVHLLVVGPMAVNSASVLEGEGRQTGLDYDQLINIFYEGGQVEEVETFYDYSSAGVEADEDEVGEKRFEEEGEEGVKRFAATSLSTPPSTSFSCAGRTPGAYYADPEAGCQLFHRFV